MAVAPLSQPSYRGQLVRLEEAFLRPYRRIILLALAAMLLGSLLLLPVALVQGWALDRLFAEPNDPAADTRALTLAVMVAIGCYLARLGLVWRGNAAMNRVSLEVVRSLTDAMHRKLQRLPLSFYDRNQTGQIMARITSDVGSLMIFLGAGSLQLASDLMLAVGIAGVLLWLRWQLALVCFLVVPLYALAHQLFTCRLQVLSIQVRAQFGGLYALLSERISAVRLIRSFAQEEAELAQLDARMSAHHHVSRASLRTAAWQSALAVFIGGAGTVVVLVMGVHLIRGGLLSVGELLAFSALTVQLYNPLVRLIQFHAGATATRVAVERMIEVLDEPEALDERPGALPIRTAMGRLSFDNVSFRYRPGGAPVLDGITFTAEPGTTVAVVGPSGAGKSTLLALAPRLYDVDAGSIRLDGPDVRDLRRVDLRRAVVLVPQQAVLFEGTLQSNLLYAAANTSAADIRRVLEALDLAELVDSLPLGLQTPVGERGVTLSGGQRQRMALARAILARPAVLLLDDCTSALDVETETRVLAALDEMLPECTRIIVSHRPSVAARADWVVVLEAGRIVWQGAPGHGREQVLPLSQLPSVNPLVSLASSVALVSLDRYTPIARTFVPRHTQPGDCHVQDTA